MKKKDVINDFEENLEDIMFNNKVNRKKSKISSVIFFSSVILILCLIIGSIIFIKPKSSPGEELIGKTTSTDGKYTIEAYLINGGATVDWTVRCYLKIDKKMGKKLIYNDYHIENAVMLWEDDDTININGHLIDLPDGNYDFRYN